MEKLIQKICNKIICYEITLYNTTYLILYVRAACQVISRRPVRGAIYSPAQASALSFKCHNIRRNPAGRASPSLATADGEALMSLEVE